MANLLVAALFLPAAQVNASNVTCGSDGPPLPLAGPADNPLMVILSGLSADPQNPTVPCAFLDVAGPSLGMPATGSLCAFTWAFVNHSVYQSNDILFVDNPMIRPTDVVADHCTATCRSAGVLASACAPEMKTAERDALVRLYQQTGGASWSSIYSQRWLQEPNACNWAGVLCDDSGSVASLSLQYLSAMPDELHLFPGMTHLFLNRASQYWDSSIPTELAQLTGLRHLDLSNNGLRGGIPTQMASLTALEGLDLDLNDLGGEIPAGLFQLTSLKRLNLDRNRLRGTLSTQIGRLTQLQQLLLEDNDLVGSLPSELYGLTALTQLVLNRNGFTGALAPEIGNLEALELLKLESTELSGEVPTEMGQLSALQQLTLDVRWFADPTFACIPADYWPSALQDYDEDEWRVQATIRHFVPLFTCETTRLLALLSILAAVIPMLLLISWRCWSWRRLTIVTSRKSQASAISSSKYERSTTRDPKDTGALLRSKANRAASLRAKVSGALAVVGWALAVIGFTPLLVVLQRRKPDDAGVPVVLAPVGILLMLLAVMPIDTLTVRNLCWGFFCSFGGLAVMYAARLYEASNVLRKGPVWRMEVWSLLVPLFTISAVAALSLLPTLPVHRCSPRLAMMTRPKLRQLWLTTRAFFAGVGVVLSANAPLFDYFIGIDAFNEGLLGGPYVEFETHLYSSLNSLRSLVPAGITFLLCALLTTRANRGRFLSFLGQLGKSSDEQQQAAAVSSLLGGVDVEVVLATAARRFRTLPVDAVTEADLLTNADTGMYEKTTPTKLGECDAFVSHSWGDKGPAKYAALRQWADAFEELGDRPLLIWLDKACINQNDIDSQLQVLPIFLSGCKELVLLAGPTFAQRLWCVMELFTFLKMGGKRERIKLLELHAGVSDTLAMFDASKAECYRPTDREHMKAIIETSFGDLRPFNKVVRGLIAERKQPAKAALGFVKV